MCALAGLTASLLLHWIKVMMSDQLRMQFVLLGETSQKVLLTNPAHTMADQRKNDSASLNPKMPSCASSSRFIHN
jgi:hypothetical protein